MCFSIANFDIAVTYDMRDETYDMRLLYYTIFSFFLSFQKRPHGVMRKIVMTTMKMRMKKKLTRMRFPIMTVKTRLLLEVKLLSVVVQC